MIFSVSLSGAIFTYYVQYVYLKVNVMRCTRIENSETQSVAHKSLFIPPYNVDKM